MTHDEKRVIRPPTERIGGRVFRPANAFIYKKMFKVGTILLLIWLGLLLLFIGFTNPTFYEIILTLWMPLEILVMIGWETISRIYIITAVILFVVGSIYTFVYVTRIEYSLRAWSGDAMPFVYSRRGIINITKKHLPFRAIVNVRTRRGIFDRVFGIGTVLIETASGRMGVQPSGLVSVIIQRLSSSAFEERIEGVSFHEELRDFIIREMRAFGIAHPTKASEKRLVRRKRILNRRTLNAFVEIRDTLREKKRTEGV